MSQASSTNTTGKQVAVVVGATSKWQSDGRNTKLAHGRALDDSDIPVGARWGIGGAIAQKFAREGFFVVLTTRTQANAAGLADAIRDQGGACAIVALDLSSQDSIATAFDTIRRDAGDPDVLIYNAGYLEGRDLPPDKELLEYIPVEMFDTAQHIASRGPFLVAREVLPAMRRKGAGSFFFSNNAKSLRGRKRMTGESLYYPRVMMRALAQVLTEEYSAFGVHVANVVIDGTIDSPGTRALPKIRNRPELVMNPVEDRRGVPLPAHTGPFVLDARTSADAVLNDAELLAKLLRKIWSGRRDSNPRPQPWQGCALPLSYARAPSNRRRFLCGLRADCKHPCRHENAARPHWTRAAPAARSHPTRRRALVSPARGTACKRQHVGRTHADNG